MTRNFDLLIAIPRLSQLIQLILAFCDNTQKVRDLFGVHIAKEYIKANIGISGFQQYVGRHFAAEKCKRRHRRYVEFNSR